MKLNKILLVSALLVTITLTGCGKSNKVTCKKEKDGVKQTVVFKYGNDKIVTDVEYTYEMEDEKDVEIVYNSIKNSDVVSNVKKDGKKISYTISADAVAKDLYAIDKNVNTFRSVEELGGFTCK